MLLLLLLLLLLPPLLLLLTPPTQVMAVGLVMLGLSMPFLVLPSTILGVGAALCFMGVSSALAVTGTLPQLAAEVERMVGEGGAAVSLDGVYSMFNTAYALGSILGPTLGLWMVQV